jgi:hypothetical protein
MTPNKSNLVRIIMISIENARIKEFRYFGWCGWTGSIGLEKQLFYWRQKKMCSSKSCENNTGFTL